MVRPFNEFGALLPSLKLLSNVTKRPVIFHIQIAEYPRPLLIYGEKALNYSSPQPIIFLEFQPESGFWFVLASRVKKPNTVKNIPFERAVAKSS